MTAEREDIWRGGRHKLDGPEEGVLWFVRLRVDPITGTSARTRTRRPYKRKGKFPVLFTNERSREELGYKEAGLPLRACDPSEL